MAELSTGLTSVKTASRCSTERQTYTDGILHTKRDADRIHELRALVEGLIKASTVECASCDYDCGQNRENCIIREAEKYIKEGVTNGLHKECS